MNLPSSLITDIVIIGGGAVGLSTAYQLTKRFPHLLITVLEKESRVSFHQTGNNSGVIHSGLYYKPGSYRAKNCIDGREELVSFAQEYDVKYEVCGKIVVATHEEELNRLDKIYQTGLENGLNQIEKIDAKQIKDYEPFCNGLQGLWVPYTGIIDFPGVCQKLASIVIGNNPKNRVLTGVEVKKIERSSLQTTIHTNGGKITTKYLIACAGLQSDRIARMDGLLPESRIVPFRGDYFELQPHSLQKVRNLIYPVPNPAFPFLGVHFTRMALGGVECGPSAVFAFKREGYTRTDFDLIDTVNALTFAGTWKLFFKHWRFGLDEYRKAFSKELFLQQLQRLIPSLTLSDLAPGRAGVRAMALKADGTMVDDFLFVNQDRSIHVLNAPSPAATACLAIGTEIVNLAEQKFKF